QKRRNSTGTLDRLRVSSGAVREGLLVDLSSGIRENQPRGVQPTHPSREQTLRCENRPLGGILEVPTILGQEFRENPRERASENNCRCHGNCTESLYSNGEFLSNQHNRGHCLCNHSNGSRNEERLYGNLSDNSTNQRCLSKLKPANSNCLTSNQIKTKDCSPQKIGCHSNQELTNSNNFQNHDLANSFHSNYEKEPCLHHRNGCPSNHIVNNSCHSNQVINKSCHSNHDLENGCQGDSSGLDVVDSAAPGGNKEDLLNFSTEEELKDLTYDLRVKDPAITSDKKKRKEFAVTLYDVEGSGQLNRQDIEGLVNKMLETLQQNKSQSELQHHADTPHQSNSTNDTSSSQQQRSKAIRINFSISPQSTLGKPSPEGTLEHSRATETFSQTMDAGEHLQNGHLHKENDNRPIDSVFVDEINEKLNNKYLQTSRRHSISSENLLIPNSPEGGRRRTRSQLPIKDNVGEHLRRKLMKVAAHSATRTTRELESFKENTSPNVNSCPISQQIQTASNDVSGLLPSNDFGVQMTDNPIHTSFADTSKNACINLANSTSLQSSPPSQRNPSDHCRATPNSPPSQRIPNDHCRASPKSSNSAFQSLLSASKKSCASSAGRLSLGGGKRFSYEKLDDGGYYAAFQGMRDGPIEEEETGVDRVSNHSPVPPPPLCEPNEYVEHTSVNPRVRPPCLLPWEQNDSSCSLGKDSACTPRRAGEYVPPPTPGGFSSLNTTAPEVHHRQRPSPDSPVRTAHATPRALRNHRIKSSHCAAARLRRRHSVCAPPVGGSGTMGLTGLLWPGGVEDREADVSADQSADEEDEDSEFGNLKHFGGVPTPLRNNSNDVRWRRRRSSSLLQRQELLQIIRANMEKNKSCFLQPRRKSSFHHHHHHHQSNNSASSHLPFPYNQHQATSEHHTHPADLRAPQTHRRRYTTNSVLSQPTGLGAVPEQSAVGAFQNPFGAGKHQRPSTDLESQLTYQFEQHQERLTRSEQKRSRLERPPNVAELTVANVTAKTLQQSREYKEYLPLPVVPVEPRAVNNQTRPMGMVSHQTPQQAMDPTTRHQYEQKKSNTSYQQHRYNKQNGKNKQSRRNHSFHFNKNDFVREENEDSFCGGGKKSSLEYTTSNGVENTKSSLGKLIKNRSFHCTSNDAVEMNTTISPECEDYPDSKLLGIRKHFARHKKSGKSSGLTSPVVEKDSDPIYDEINLAESKKLEQDLLSFSQPLYLSRRDMKEPISPETMLPTNLAQPTVQCFNLKLNENNRIVYDDSNEKSNHGNGKNGINNHGNAKSFVYKQKLYASSPSTQQKILRRSKSGLIEPEVKAQQHLAEENDLVKETSRLCLDSNADSENDVRTPSKGNSRLNSPGTRHQSPSTKNNGRFYKHYNLDSKILDKSENLNKSEEGNFLAHRTETTEFNEVTRRNKSVSDMKTSKQSSKQTAKDHSGKSPAKSAGSELKKSPNKKCIEKRTSGGEIIKQSRVVRNLKTQQLNIEDGPSRDGNSRTHTRSAEENSGELGMKPSVHETNRSEGVGNEVGVVNNHIYINTREHHLCCINVLEHTLCCHSNLTHDNFCCQGRNKPDASPSGCKPNNLIVNVLPSRTGEKSSAHALNNGTTSSPARCHSGNALSPPELSSKSCSHQHGHRSGGHCSLHYLKHKYRDENERLAREQVIKWLENDFTAEEGKLTLDREFLRGAGKYRGKNHLEEEGNDEKCSDEEDLLIEESGSEEEEEERREKGGVQLHKHVHHHFYHFDSVLV
ncbi:hypothetical protein WDU94_000525, partial [Cyamophila willieti]